MGTELAVSESQQQLSPCSIQATKNLSECEARLEPCGAKTGTAELMACLTLVAPSGMSAEDRTAWVSVARQTLSGIPSDLLKWGCAEARAKCRFASEIVPLIIQTVSESWERRQQAVEWARRAVENANKPRLEAPEPPKRHVLDRRGEEMSAEDTDELNRILEGMGAKMRYRPDGSKHEAGQ
jgi:hypothetical protein